MLFRGHAYRSLDPKGRLVLPAEFRDALMSRSPEGRFVLTTYDGCIVGFPEPDWLIFEEKFSKLANSSRKMRDFRRLVISGAEVMEMDAQGRLRISRAQMDYAGLSHEVAVAGQGNRFEIWDQTTFKGLLDQNFDDVTEELAESGIDLCL